MLIFRATCEHLVCNALRRWALTTRSCMTWRLPCEPSAAVRLANRTDMVRDCTHTEIRTAGLQHE